MQPSFNEKHIATYRKNVSQVIYTDIYHYLLYDTYTCMTQVFGLVGWLVVLRINVDLAIFQPHLDLEAGDNQSLKIQVARHKCLAKHGQRINEDGR